MTDNERVLAQELFNDYSEILPFIEKHNNLTEIEFDYYVVNEMSLFVVKENFNFEALEQMLTKIKSTVPSMKRIFAKPIIHLIDEDEVLPVENVKRINNDTLTHIAVHSELWDDITEDGIKPFKLLSRVYKDNFSIYENILFTKTVDCVMSYLKKNMRILKNLMYASEVLEFNLLERVNHLKYFLAIGKLHTGYIRDFDKYYALSKKAYNQMSYIYESLLARLKRNVYRANKDYRGKFSVHNTNILKMQKDYHKVYLLISYFNKIKEVPEELNFKKIGLFDRSYTYFLRLLVIFAATHFDFSVKDGSKIDFENFDVILENKDWQLHVTSIDDCVKLVVKKEKEYSIVIAKAYKKDNYDYFDVDETIFVTPFDDEKYKFVGVEDVDSFRRIQQIILRGMVYSDSKFDVCPFCGEKLEDHSIDTYHEYLCRKCNTIISEETCEHTGRKYLNTRIYGFVPGDKIQGDGKFHFRNINDYTSELDYICPHCKRIHKINKDDK